MKLVLVLLTASVASASALAAPSFECQPSDRNLAPLVLTVKSHDQVSFAAILDGKPSPETTLSRDDALNPPGGYSAFFGRGGCNQDGEGPHCFAIWQNTLLLSNDLLDGGMHGSATLNGEGYRCEMLLK